MTFNASTIPGTKKHVKAVLPKGWCTCCNYVDAARRDRYDAHRDAANADLKELGENLKVK